MKCGKKIIIKCQHYRMCMCSVYHFHGNICMRYRMPYGQCNYFFVVVVVGILISLLKLILFVCRLDLFLSNLRSFSYNSTNCKQVLHSDDVTFFYIYLISRSTTNSIHIMHHQSSLPLVLLKLLLQHRIKHQQLFVG